MREKNSTDVEIVCLEGRIILVVVLTGFSLRPQTLKSGCFLKLLVSSVCTIFYYFFGQIRALVLFSRFSVLGCLRSIARQL